MLFLQLRYPTNFIPNENSLKIGFRTTIIILNNKIIFASFRVRIESLEILGSSIFRFLHDFFPATGTVKERRRKEGKFQHISYILQSEKKTFRSRRRRKIDKKRVKRDNICNILVIEYFLQFEFPL